MPTSSYTTASQGDRLADALSDYLAGERALLELKCCAPRRLSALIHDLSRPLLPSLERALARGLNSGELADWLGPAETLMPPMMARFGLDPEALATAPQAAEWRVTCRACPHTGTCWQALRHGAEACRTFCPNAEAFAAAGRESKRLSPQPQARRITREAKSSRSAVCRSIMAITMGICTAW